jgi:hypothetical protein
MLLLNSVILVLAPNFSEKAIKDALDKGAVGIEVSTASPDARRLYERHHFKQFMGKGTMGEVFLELDIEEYKRNQKIKGQAADK